MVRRFSWCTSVALVVLLFVTTEGLRERSSQGDDRKATSRGTLKYNPKSSEEITTLSPFTRSRLTRDRSSQPRKSSNIERYSETTTLRYLIDPESTFESAKHLNPQISRTNDASVASSATETTLTRTSSDPSVNRRNGKAYTSQNNDRKSKTNENATGEASKSRRTSNGRSSGSSGTERLDNKGPSVFTITTESSKSRTGRKIQTTYSMKDLKTQIPASRRYNNKPENTETTTIVSKREGRGRHTTERTERSTRSSRSKSNNKESNSINRKSQDPILYESESVRVDIPLTVEGTESPNDVGTTTSSPIVSQRRSDTKESRSGARKNRGRTNDSEAAGSSRNSSRRGSSKFNDVTTTEISEQIVSSRKNTVSKDRSRDGRKSTGNESRSRSRGRGGENNARNGSIDGSERDVKRKSVGERNSSDRRSKFSDGTARFVENRGQEQDARRSRSRSRVDVTTTLAADVTTTVAPDTTVSNDVTSTDSETTATTSNASSRTTTTRPTTIAASTTDGPGRGRGRGRGGNQARKLHKEDFFNHGLGFRGRKSTLNGSNVGDSRKNGTPKTDSQSHGNPGWTLRRRPPNSNYSETASRTIVSLPRDQTNEVIPSNEQSTSTETVTTVESTSSTTRRGFKKLQTAEESTTEVDATTKSPRRGNKTFDKNKTFGKANENEESDNYPPDFKARLAQLKNTNTKTAAPKATSRTPLEVKRSSASLFAERSRMKLDLARRLVKPELNIEENDLDATTASSFSKPKPIAASTVDETNKVAKFKPSTGRKTTTDKSVRVEKSSKLSSSRTAAEDRFARPSLKKGRIISERMVTSISVEERAVEKTTRPYSSTNPSVTSVSAEEGSATTIDTTRVPPTNARNGKKSKEEDSNKSSKVSVYHDRRVDNNDRVTTFKPKKPYVFQPRGSKSYEQFTTPEQNLVSSKKSFASFKSSEGRSQEEDASKEEKFASGVTKPSFRPRYSKRTKPKSNDEKSVNDESASTTKLPVATSRYSRKKAAVKATESKSKATTDETAARKLEFRPRTATYRRHSEVPTTLVESSTKVDVTGVAITPRPTRYHATLKTSTPLPRSVPQEPQVNLMIANDTAQQPAGITGSSNGDSGNTNIFNPTRSTVLSSNSTLLEQLRSTVAPLLNSLGNRTPVFSGSYSNVNNANLPPRITPNGSPPRFSARYKGAELFVRKQNNIYQPTVPSITSSSTTPVTPVEVFTTKITEEIEAVAPPSWTNHIGVITTPSGNLDLNGIDTNKLR